MKHVKGTAFIQNVFRTYFRFRKKKGLESKFRKWKAIGISPVAIRLKSVCIKQILCAKIFMFYWEKLQVQWSLYVPRGLTFTNSTFCPHSVIMCFVWIWEQTAIVSLYSIDWLVFITETECVYCAVRTGYVTFTNSTFWPQSVFMCFMWISEQTAIISLYNINWLVFITEMVCVYCAVRTECLNVIQVNVGL